MDANFATIRELFDQDDLDLIFEALEHRRQVYKIASRKNAPMPLAAAFIPP